MNRYYPSLKREHKNINFPKSWSHNQAQKGNSVQLGFSIEVTLRQNTQFRGTHRKFKVGAQSVKFVRPILGQISHRVKNRCQAFSKATI